MVFYFGVRCFILIHSVGVVFALSEHWDGFDLNEVRLSGKVTFLLFFIQGVSWVTFFWNGFMMVRIHYPDDLIFLGENRVGSVEKVDSNQQATVAPWLVLG